MDIFTTDTIAPHAFRIVANSQGEFSLEKQVSRFQTRPCGRGGTYVEVIKQWIPLAGDTQFSVFADSSADIYLNMYRKVYPSLELAQAAFNDLPQMRRDEKWEPVCL